MRIRIDRDSLADAVAWTARTLPAKPALPVLAGVHLRAEAAQLSLSAFDYEVSAETAAQAQAEETGEILVPGRLLADITRSLPDQPVEMATDGARLSLRCGSSSFALPLLPLEEYPSLPAMPEQTGTLGSDAFAAAVAAVAVAAGRDDTLPVLTGVRMEIEGEVLTLAATDRYRLAVRTMRWQPEDPAVSAVALVPSRTLADTAKALAVDAHVGIALAQPGAGDGLIGFVGSGRRTTTRLLDGEFPKYRSLLPSETAATATIATTSLLEAVRRVSLVAARNTSVRLSFSADGLVLEAGGLDDAQATETLPAAFEGEPLTIAFNPAYLLDGLTAIDSDEARLSFTTPTKPAVITGKTDDSDPTADYRYLLMPVRLSG